jgi:hypothetical protein
MVEMDGMSGIVMILELSHHDSPCKFYLAAAD